MHCNRQLKLTAMDKNQIEFTRTLLSQFYEK